MKDVPEEPSEDWWRCSMVEVDNMQDVREWDGEGETDIYTKLNVGEFTNEREERVRETTMTKGMLQKTLVEKLDGRHTQHNACVCVWCVCMRERERERERGKVFVRVNTTVMTQGMPQRK